MKQQFLKGKTGTLRFGPVFQDNIAIIPDSALVTLYEPGSDTVLQAQATATVDPDTGEMTYSLTATHTANNNLNFKAVWEYVYNGETLYDNQLFDVVLNILYIPIIDEDIYDELESLRAANAQATGTATAATASTLVDTVRRKEDDDFWKGGTLKIIAGTGVGQERDVTGFTQSTSTFAVTPNYVTTPDATSLYKIVRSFTKKINTSFMRLEDMLYEKGKRHELILESSQIKYPLIYLTIHNICLDIMDEIDDKWFLLADKYWDKFTQAFGNLTLEYDEDESGNISPDEEQQSVSELRIFRG